MWKVSSAGFLTILNWEVLLTPWRTRRHAEGSRYVGVLASHQWHEVQQRKVLSSAPGTEQDRTVLNRGTDGDEWLESSTMGRELGVSRM